MYFVILFRFSQCKTEWNTPLYLKKLKVDGSKVKSSYLAFARTITRRARVRMLKVESREN